MEELSFEGYLEFQQMNVNFLSKDRTLMCGE
jgi:hypothetical protein